MDIMLTVMRDDVSHATTPVSLAMENTAHSAYPADQAGTNKEMDVFKSALLGKAPRCVAKSYMWQRALLNYNM